MSSLPKAPGWKSPALALEAGSAVADREAGEIMARLARKDGSAMVDLYQQLGAPLYTVALRILGDRGEAEEALQDALVRVWERAETYDRAKGRPFTWCFTILRGLCIDRLRQRTAEKRGGRKIVPFDAEDVAETCAHPGGDARANAMWAEEIARVLLALESLHPLERRYIEQAIFSGHTHPEIADLGNEPLGTVKTRIRRGMMKLRGLLRTREGASGDPTYQP